MTTQYNHGRSLTGTMTFFLFAAIVGAATLALFLHRATSGPMGNIAALVSGRAVSIDASAAMVVDKIQRLNRLETVVYSLDTVVEGSRTNPVLPDVLTGDKMLMVVHGQSIAGVDMAQLKPEDVRIDGRTIHVALPASQIFVTTLDNQRTKVYSRTTGVLVPADPNLESQVRVKAQDQLQQAALSDGILDAARKNARATVSTMLSGLGFEHVDVN